MSASLELFLLFIVIIIIVIIAVLNSIAAYRITKIETYQDDPELIKAHSDLIWSALAGWFGLIIIVAILAAYLPESSITESKKDQKGRSNGITVFLVISIILIIITGVLSAIASVDMDRSKISKNELKQNGARAMTNVSSILGIVGGILVIVVLIAPYFKSKKGKNGGKEAEAEELAELAV